MTLADPMLLGNLSQRERALPDVPNFFGRELGVTSCFGMEQTMFAESDELHVIDADAHGVTAEMMDHESVGDGAVNFQVGGTMGIASRSTVPSVLAASGSLPDVTGSLVAEIKYVVHEGLTSVVEVARMGQQVHGLLAQPYLGMKTKEV